MQQLLKLESLVEELVNVTEIKDGKFNYQKSAFDLQELLHEVSGQLAIVSRTQIKHSEALSKPFIIFADRERIGQVIQCYSKRA